MEQTNTRQTTSDVLRERGRIIARRNSWLQLLVCASASVVCSLVLFGLLLGLAVVHGDSMNPSYRNSDTVLFSRLARLGSYESGDVVILEADAEGLRKYLKRVIGVPGDVISIDEQGAVIVNGEALDEPYAMGVTDRGVVTEYPVQLAEDEYFVLGDNREDSKDSRIMGAIEARHINGKVLAVLRFGS